MYDTKFEGKALILSFKDKLTQAVDDGSIKKGFPADLLRRAQQLLAVLDAATELNDLRSPPGNHLERLSGNRQGHLLRLDGKRSGAG